MPSEHRQIIFSVHETIRALSRLASTRPLHPGANIVNLKVITAGNTVSGIGTMRPIDDEASFEVPVPAETIAAALIKLCVNQGIPLPRNADKRLAKAGDGIALHLDLNAGSVPINDMSDAAALADKTQAKLLPH